MRDRQRGDASFLLGLVLGIFVGTAIVLILYAEPGDVNPVEFSEQGQEDRPSLEKAASDAKDEAREAKDTMQAQADQTRERVEGAAEGAAE